jgi:hypothetical protein
MVTLHPRDGYVLARGGYELIVRRGRHVLARRAVTVR